MPADENLSIPVPEKNWRMGFWSLIATQFQGAFNDNGLKFFVIFLILGTNPTESQKDFLSLSLGISLLSRSSCFRWQADTSRTVLANEA